MKKSLGRFISILHRQSQVYINYSLRQFDITSAEYAFLLYLFRKDGVTQDELSTYLYIDKAATARSIKSLQQKGYVIKDKDEKDKRCNRIRITDKAKAHMDDILQRVWSWSDLLTKDLDHQTLDTIITVLEDMVCKVEHTDLKGLAEEL